MSIRPWPLIGSEQVYGTGLFRVTRDRACSPRTGEALDFEVVHMTDWLMVVALTGNGRLVMVRQYRHGAREAGLEVPGGLLDPADAHPEEGAARELAEETGYGGGRLELLGRLRPQPALFSNSARIYVAKNVRRVAEPKLDAGEDIEVVLIDRRQVADWIAGGEITNAMTIAALGLAQFAGHL